MESDFPYWWPERTDEKWIKRIRKDYPDSTSMMSDEAIRYEYAHDARYADVWDHVGDARWDYAQLADAFLSLFESLTDSEQEAFLAGLD